MKAAHLNFCRHLTKQYSSMVEIPGFDATDRARMHHAMDLAAASQKFLLPDGGLLIDDPELRAVDESEPLRLPHPFIALEFLHADDEEKQHVLTKRIVFARERDQFIHLSGAGCSTHDGIWVWMPECAIPKTDYLVRSDMSGGATVLYRPLAPWEAGPDLYPMYLKVFMCFLNALGCSNVRAEKSAAKQNNKSIKSALPFDTYHILTINTSASNGACSSANNAHRSPREHLRRGHIRRLEDGRRIWVNATVVAAGKSAGKVSKDYRLTNRVAVA